MDSDVLHGGERESDGGWAFLLIGSVQPLPHPTRTTPPHSSGYLTSLSRTEGKLLRVFLNFDSKCFSWEFLKTYKCSKI